MFKERLNTVFDIIGAKNTDIADIAGIDCSAVSRMRNGSRTPKPTSPTAKKLTDAICIYAARNGKTAKLSEAVSDGKTVSPEKLAEHLFLWLFPDCDPNDTGRKKQIYVDAPYILYGRKLNTAMSIAGITNAALCDFLHIDVSAISRFRNGTRMPKAGSKLSDEICKVLFDTIMQNNSLDLLAETIAIPNNAVSDREKCFEYFSRWLCDFDESDTGIYIEKLLENISSFSADIKIPLPTFEEAAKHEILSDQKSIYYSTEGLQTAVIRFLGSAVQNNAEELLLYSDQPMDWMVKDTAFRLKWAALMRECIGKGIKIRIIHNIDRGIAEMTAAINSWLPLYMSGLIESFYCKKTKGERFSQTIFLCPGLACIEASNVNDCESNGIYYYHTDSRILKIRAAQYKKLLGMSGKLVKICYAEEAHEKVNEGENVHRIDGNTPNTPFANVNVLFSDKAAAVTRLLPPNITFLLSHPKMCKAFCDYNERVNKNQKKR
ncbi:MAG: helix-turn-helix transcriptional regulator [Firmicutes bacterium]|nr:helix-turn-helix transcriptional regulator [Bacillota bacterium]